MNCDLNRSMTVGFITMLIMGIIVLIWLNMQTPEISYTASNIFLFATVFFIIGTSMDYFNQCYTTCKNFGSSLTFGAFTVAIIYFFCGLFISDLEINFSLFIAFVLNSLIIAGLHYVTCDDIHLTDKVNSSDWDNLISKIQNKQQYREQYKEQYRQQSRQPYRQPYRQQYRQPKQELNMRNSCMFMN